MTSSKYSYPLLLLTTLTLSSSIVVNSAFLASSSSPLAFSSHKVNVNAIRHSHIRTGTLSLSSSSTNTEVTSSSSPSPSPSSSAISITKDKLAILDGSSYKSLQAFVSIEQQQQQSSLSSSSEVGVCKIIIGALDNKRVVAMADADDNIWEESIATIPNSISDDDAMSTLLASLSGIHCSIHDPKRKEDDIVQYVGGSNDSFEVMKKDKNVNANVAKKVVVLGGSDYACFLADGIAALGGKVTQVSTNKLLQMKLPTLPTQSSSSTSVERTLPGVDMGKDMEEVPFASAIGKFDALVDTLTDESTSTSPPSSNDIMCRLGYDYTAESSMPCNSAVITELNKQNQCHRYISTVSQSQQTIRDDGILFGRGKADKYGKNLVDKVLSTSNQAQKFEYIIPPKQFASLTLQPLLQAGVVYKQNNDAVRRSGNNNNGKEVILNGWNLSDFWELVSWPRDAEGGNVRFGLPMVEDLDSSSYYNYYGDEEDDEDENINVAQELPEEEDGIAMATPISSPGKTQKTPPKDEYEGKTNPHVVNVNSLAELNEQIIKPKKACVLFLSAQYCRTCKYLSPQYTKLARNNGEEEIVFAKTNTVGKVGKEVSRALGVDAVPAFCFFRDGNRYGTTLSVSKMPSKKLNAAIELLMSGEEWDGKKIRSLK